MISNKRFSLSIFFVMLVTLVAPATAQKPLLVKYAKSENTSAIYIKQSQYFLDLCKLALTKSGYDFDFKTVGIPSSIPQGRSILLLQQGVYDVHWMTTNPEREALLRPIRVPLFKGLIGFRLMFVHQDTANLFAHINSVEQLKAFLAGQGRDWPDTQLMRQQGFRIQEATNTDGLIQMLNKKRLDYMPRSILEIWHEKELFQSLPIMVDEHIALRYPSAIYFFVTKDNKILHDAIEKGLNNAIKDGSFDKLFYDYIGQDIVQSRLSDRTILTIPNPNMTEETPLDKDEYWFTVKRSSKAK